MNAVTIYHNPKCATSRNALAIIKESAIEPKVVEYLKTPPTREVLETLIDDMKIDVRDIIRRRGKLYDELGLGNENLSDDALIDVLTQNPVLMERPIVVTPKGTKICRPAAVVRDIL